MQGNLEMPVQVSKAGMAVIDENGHLMESNQRFYSLIDAPESGGSPEDWIDRSANPVLEKGMEVLRNSVCPESVSMELKVASSDRDRTLNATLSRLPDGGTGAEVRFLLMLEEAPVHESGHALERQEVQKAIRSRFDHDLRSRLNVILGYCSMMIEDLADKDDAAEMIEDLKCVISAGNDLLALNRKNSDLLGLIQGSWSVCPEELLPANILADTIQGIRPRFPEHRFWLEADDSTVRTDANILSKLIGSLLFRLCQEMSSGCKIRTTAKLDAASGAYEVMITCTPSAKAARDKENLRNLIGQLKDRKKNDTKVPNLDLFYADTLCDFLGARMEAIIDMDNGQAGYKIELPVPVNQV